jgi:glycosyltransferase 2 family protein
MTEVTSSKSDRKFTWSAVAGYLVAVAALIWVFYGIKPEHVFGQISNVNWALAATGVALDFCRYLTQSLRWQLLLSSFGRISVVKTLKALYSGVFVNLVFPMRLGEVARAYIASRSASLAFPSVLSSLLVEYLFDGLWLAIGMGFAGIFVKLPVQIMGAVRILGPVIIAASILFCIIIFVKNPFIKKYFTQKEEPVKSGRRAVLSFFTKIRLGMKSMSLSRMFIPAFIVSGVDLFFHACSFWMIMKSYGILLPPVTALAVAILFLQRLSYPMRLPI